MSIFTCLVPIVSALSTSVPNSHCKWSIQLNRDWRWNQNNFYYIIHLRPIREKYENWKFENKFMNLDLSPIGQLHCHSQITSVICQNQLTADICQIWSEDPFLSRLGFRCKRQKKKRKRLRSQNNKKLNFGTKKRLYDCNSLIRNYDKLAGL